jgi:glycosyltransferase involved in cell wall biosynthesis
MKGDGRSHPIVAVIPAYNEERYIGSVVLTARVQPLRALVLDRGSKGDTHANSFLHSKETD